MEAKGRQAWGTALLFVPAAALGLWVSLHYAFATWHVESDAADPYVLWHGFLRDGIGFFSTFRYAPDNWLLWPLPAFFLAFAAFGDEPWVEFAGGWALFVACVLFAFLIARRAAGTAAAAAAAAVLLLSNRGTLGEMGFLTYPVSHNASLSLGLLGLYAALRWLETKRWPWLALLVAALAMAGLSDPWTEAAITLPIACGTAGLILDTRHASGRRTAILLAVAAGLAIIIVHTRLFGLLGFLPSTPITFASGADRLRAAAWLGRLGAMWFNFLPGRGAAYAWIPTTTEAGANLTLLVLGIGAAAALAFRQAGRNAVFDMLWLTGSTSCVVIAAAFVVLDLPRDLTAGRFFVATYIFGVVLFATSVGRAWGSLPRIGRLAAASYSLLLPAAGLASAPAAWQTAGLASIPDDGIRQFAAFLQAHGLHYGYGPYWSVQANAVAWATRGAVVIRPISFYPATGRPAPFYTQVSPRWYTPADMPPDQRSAFLALTPGPAANDCPDIPACIEAAEQQFGPPQELLHYGETVVLTWNHWLFGTALELAAAHAALLPVGKVIDLTSAGARGYVLGEGWSRPETIGTWTDGTKADVLLRLPSPWTGPARVAVEASAFTPPGTASQDVTVSFDGRRLAHWKVASGDYKPYSAVLPAALLGVGSGALELTIPGAISPKAAGIGKDGRKLGINVRTLRITGTTDLP